MGVCECRKSRFMTSSACRRSNGCGSPYPPPPSCVTVRNWTAFLKEKFFEKNNTFSLFQYFLIFLSVNESFIDDIFLCSLIIYKFKNLNKIISVLVALPENLDIHYYGLFRDCKLNVRDPPSFFPSFLFIETVFFHLRFYGKNEFCSFCL